MGQQYVAHQREADALTIALGTEKGREQLLPDLGREAGTIVFDDDRGRVGRGAHPQVAVVPHGFKGIFGDVEQGLLLLLGIEQEHQRRGGQLQMPRNAALRALGLKQPADAP